MSQELSLPAQVVDLLLAVATSMGADGLPLTMQAQHARATTYSPTYIDIVVPANCDYGKWQDGPLDVKPVVIDRDGEPIGEVLVWVSEGRVTLLEQAWFTDDPPTTWPSMDSVRIS